MGVFPLSAFERVLSFSIAEPGGELLKRPPEGHPVPSPQANVASISERGGRRTEGVERRIWHPSGDRWVIIDRDGSLIDVHRTNGERLSFHASSNEFDPRELETWMRGHGHLT